MERFKDTIQSKRDAAREVIMSKLNSEDIQALYDFFNVDDNVHISKEHGVESLVPFGADGPKLENGSSIEVYALDKYAREFAQRLVRIRFHQLINPEPLDKPKKKDKTLV